MAALPDALAKYRDPKDPADAHRLFITKYATAWVRYHDGEEQGKGVTVDNVGREFTKVRVEAGVDGGRGFYSLRHTFETIAGETGDQKAVDFIMGHVPDSSNMSARYREWTGDAREQARLRRITDHVRSWLFPPAKPAKAASKGAKPAGSSKRSRRAAAAQQT